jgi:hypothetical protein
LATIPLRFATAVAGAGFVEYHPADEPDSGIPGATVAVEMDHTEEQSTSIPRAAMTSPPPSRAQEMLLDFLREHDTPCPVCGYNLKALTRPICPECGQELVLSVGAARLRLGWLLAAVAPGFFSGIAAIFMLVPIVGVLAFGNGRLPLLIPAVDLFGWCSGVFAIILAIKRYRFIAKPRSTQRWWALGIWFIHVAVLGLLILYIVLQN